MKTLFDLFIQELPSLDHQELEFIRQRIVDLQGGDQWREEARAIKAQMGPLESVKFIKQKTGLGLKESKAIMDNL